MQKLVQFFRLSSRHDKTREPSGEPKPPKAWSLTSISIAAAGLPQSLCHRSIILIHIALTTDGHFPFQLSGTFFIPRSLAEVIVSRRVVDHGITFDRDLEFWLHSLPTMGDNVHVPKGSHLEDRLLFVMAEAIAQKGDIEVRCNRCQTSIPIESITIAEKDFSTETSGMRMGFAGELYRCPYSHDLLFVMTKIY